MLLIDIHVRAFTGATLKTYLHSLAKLRVDVFREYPYLREPNLLEETAYLKRFCTSKEAIGVLVFDNTTLVGASLGIPLSLETEEFQKPFLENALDPNAYFFFGESALLKNYRGRGIGHHFFDVREAHVLQYKKYKHICFCTPQRPENDPLKPPGYLLLNDFWRKRGYIHTPEFNTTLTWKEIGKKEPEAQVMTFWIKDI